MGSILLRNLNSPVTDEPATIVPVTEAVDVGASFNQTSINTAINDVAAKINELRAALVAKGDIA